MNWPTTPAAMAQAQAAYAKQQEANTADFLSAEPDLSRDGFDLTGRLAESSLHRQFGEWQEPEGLEADEDMAVLRGLHDTALQRFKDMVGTIIAVRDDDDPSLNKEGRLKIAAKVIEPKLGELAQTVQREFTRVAEAIEQEEEQILQTVRKADALDISTFDGIRSYWRSDAAEKQRRMLMLPESLEGDAKCVVQSLDTQTLQALALAPAYMSGLTDRQHDAVRTALAVRMAPERIKRVRALRIGMAVTTQALQTLDRKAHKFVDFKRARALIEREAKRNATP
jgi:hypothetical protein